ncbi:hypothetical protein NDU88_012673 [Pleurodeles waltl]|uniref:Uncharacterized protein n=1 Tax=Pleurodeles waltl TaxID=8319 RepID=A0AAV7R548_PLEWA|nr:hypothetical protein NDU88_012673 [Pleurodeles waltl]
MATDIGSRLTQTPAPSQLTSHRRASPHDQIITGNRKLEQLDAYKRWSLEEKSIEPHDLTARSPAGPPVLQVKAESWSK